MPCIYARFMEKEARQWREIYKALQLLEYLIKHGSERVVDDARSHISTIKMLRNFHYIDDKGKDEGLNGKLPTSCITALEIADGGDVVRNRARELAEVLSDVEKIRAERRKAKANRHKYTGTGNDGMGFGSGGRYGGFEGGSYGNGGGSYNGGSSSYDRGEKCTYWLLIWHNADDLGVFADSGSGYSGGSSGGFRDETRRGGFEEYNAGDDEVSPNRSDFVSQQAAGNRLSSSNSSRRVTPAAAPAPPKPKEPEVDLLGGFGDEDVIASGADTNVFATEKALPALTSPPAFSAAPATTIADGVFTMLQFPRLYHGRLTYIL